MKGYDIIMRKNMPKEDYELFSVIVQSTQSKLQKMLYKILKRHYTNITNTSDYIMAQGDIPVALVAHMDTVFKLPPEEIYYDRKKGVLWSPDGLGADDRAGVFLIIKILQNVKKGKKPFIIFTTDEECGCLGSSQLVNDFEKCPFDLKYIIQLDRRGKNDCVFYDNVNVAFGEYVESFGFKTAWGTLSDISVICPCWGISGVNLSVGYEDEHQEIETFHVDYAYMTLIKVLSMLDDIDKADYFKYEGSTYSTQWWRYGHLLAKEGYYPGWDDDDDWNYPYSYNSSEFCYSCGKKVDKVTAIKAKDDYGRWHYLCGQCAAEHVSWCNECGAAFIMPKYGKWQNTCADCVAKTWETKEGDQSDESKV